MNAIPSDNSLVPSDDGCAVPSPVTSVIEGGVLIKAISIIRADVVCLFHQDFGTGEVTHQHPQLLGGFFSAIIQWAQVNSGQDLHSIKLDEDVILIENDKDLYFILQFKPLKLDIEGARLILYQILAKFVVTFPDAEQIADSAQFDSFYDTVPQMILEILQQTVEVYCPSCGNSHTIVLDRKSFLGVPFPVKYSYIHGDSQVMLTLYLDQDFHVIKTEVVDLFEMKENELTNMLDEQDLDPQDLKSDQVYGFLLTKGGITRTHYLNLQWDAEVDFAAFKEVWKFGVKSPNAPMLLDKFFLKQEKFWIAGVRKNAFELILLTSPDLTADQLDAQTVAFLDRLTSSF